MGSRPDWKSLVADAGCVCGCHDGSASHVGPCRCGSTSILSSDYMKVYVDLFAGTGSATKAFRLSPGWYGIHVEKDGARARVLRSRNMRHAVLNNDVLELEPGKYPFTGIAGEIEFLWASPPCPTFSLAGLSHHWDAFTRCRGCGNDIRRIEDKGWEGCACSPSDGAWPSPGALIYVPITDEAKLARELVLHTLYLVETLRPKYWVIENPRNLLRKMPWMEGIPVRTVTYCAYGDKRQKPTDLFGVLPDAWMPRPVCARGADCHEAAPRGSKSGTQGISDLEVKSMVPEELSQSIFDAVEGRSEELFMPTPEWGGAVS